MNSEVALVLASKGTQVLPQVILDSDYLPDYLSVSYDYVLSKYSSKKFCLVQGPFGWSFSAFIESSVKWNLISADFDSFTVPDLI